MARTAAALTDSATASTFDESALLESALVSSVSRFRHICYHARHAQDPEGYADDEVAAVEARELWLVTGGDGMLHMRGTFDSAGGATIRTAVEALSGKSGQDDTRHQARRMADTLVELAGHCMDAGVLPNRGTQRPHIQVTTSFETFVGLSGCPAAELEYSLPISTKTLQRLTCHCSVTSVLFGANSAISDVSRAQRSVRGATRLALHATHPGCCWPGCDRPDPWTEVHHLKHWSKGGRSELSNLVPLCMRHHWMVHGGGWQILRTAEDRIVTVPPATHLTRQLAREPGTLFLA